jgi:hypothetical protein
MVADFPRASSDGTIRLRHAHGVRLDSAGVDARGYTIYVKADVRVRGKTQIVRYSESGRTGTIHPANSAAHSHCLLLSQGKRAGRYVEGCCTSAHANLAGVGWISADGAITLASSAPEHVPKHSRTGA